MKNMRVAAGREGIHSERENKWEEAHPAAAAEAAITSSRFLHPKNIHWKGLWMQVIKHLMCESPYASINADGASSPYASSVHNHKERKMGLTA